MNKLRGQRGAMDMGSGKSMEEEHRYDDIINLPHHRSAVRPHMSASDRAAQFSPFAALTGYEAAIAEAVRRFSAKQEKGENEDEGDITGY